MKKILMGTTALVAATAVTSGAAQAGETSMDITGYNYTAYGVFSNDAPSDVSNGNDLYQNGEVHFNASTTLDSGLTIAYQIQYETEVGAVSVDENFITLSDSWGSIIAGGENLPNYKTHVTGAMYTGWHGINTNTITNWAGVSTEYGITSEFHTAFMNTYGLFSHDDTDNVSYYTPRISGLQFGIGYAPDNQQNDGGNGAAAIQDTISAGLNYSSEMSGVGIAASAGYIVHGDGGSASGDADMWNFGLQLSSGGFTAGVSYAFSDDDENGPFGTTTNGVNESNTITAGITYATGPYQIGLGYVHGEAEGTIANTSEDEGDAAMVSLSYSLGGGATWDAHLVWRDLQGEVAGNSDDVENFGVITGIAVNF